MLGFGLLLRASAIQARLALPCFVTTRDSPSKAWPLRSLFQSLMALGLSSAEAVFYLSCSRFLFFKYEHSVLCK